MHRSRSDAATVSVVVPTYYRNERLERAIESVLAATHEPTELIVVDGSGEEHARPVVGAYDDVEYVPQERDEGPHAARSLGAARATGDYVQFLDDDDRIVDGKFTDQIALLEDRPDVGVAYGGFEAETGGVALPADGARGDVLRRALQWELHPCCTSTMLLDRETLDRIHPLRHRHGADDLGMMIELARVTEFDYVDAPVIRRGEPEDSLGCSWENVEGRRRLFEAFADLYDSHPPEVRNQALAHYHARRGRKLVEENLWSPRAITSFARATWYAPNPSLAEVGPLVYSLGGRPARRLASIVWERIAPNAPTLEPKDRS